jgi:SPW repeat
LIVSPFVLTYSTLPTATGNDVILGIVVMILAIWSIVAKPASRQPVRC